MQDRQELTISVMEEEDGSFSTSVIACGNAVVMFGMIEKTKIIISDVYDQTYDNMKKEKDRADAQ